MNNSFKGRIAPFFGIVLALVIGFSFTACNDLLELMLGGNEERDYGGGYGPGGYPGGDGPWGYDSGSDNQGGGGDDPGGNDQGGDGDNSTRWLHANQKVYTVTNGVAEGISYEFDVTWIDYTDDRHFESQHSYTEPVNRYNEYETYTVSQVGSYQYNNKSRLDGNTLQNISHIITDTTTTTHYVNSSSEDSVTSTNSDITITTTYEHDEDSGITRSILIEQTGTQNDSPYYYSEANYTTLEWLDTDSDGVRTYKWYDATTDGTGAYHVYKVKNGTHLEHKTYSAGDVLVSTQTYTFFEIKNLTFSLSRTTNENTPQNDSYQTCELIYDSPTEFTIRLSTYKTGTEILTNQYDQTYKSGMF